GLFVWSSLTRKGGGRFLYDRLLRIGAPLIVAVGIFMAVAYFPTHPVRGGGPSLLAHLRARQARPFLPRGPQWFLWQLLAFNIIASALYQRWPHFGEHLGRLASSARERPSRFFLGLVAVSAIAYVPMALAFSPWQWGHLGPIAFQLCRPL